MHNALQSNIKDNMLLAKLKRDTYIKEHILYIYTINEECQ